MVTTTSKETGKRAKKANPITDLFAKKAAPTSTETPAKLPPDAAGVETVTQEEGAPVNSKPADVDDEAAAPADPNGRASKKGASQPSNEEASVSRKRKEPPSDTIGLHVAPGDTQEVEDGKPAAEDDFVLPPGATFQQPASGEDETEQNPGLTFQQMWEEMLAKAPEDRAKTWATATTEFNKAISTGDGPTIRQTITAWRTQAYGTNFAVIYRDAEGNIQVLHALDSVQAGVLGLRGGTKNPKEARLVAIAVEKWGLIEMYPASTMHAKKTTTTAFKKGDRKTPIPIVRAITPEQLEMMLGSSKTPGEWYRVYEEKTRKQARTSRTDIQLMQYLRAAATKTAPNTEHPLTFEVEELAEDMEIAQIYKATAFQRFYGRATDGRSISTRSAATAFEHWSFKTGGTQPTPPTITHETPIPRHQPPQNGPPTRVQYETTTHMPPTHEQPAPETHITGNPQQNPTNTGDTIVTQQQMHAGTTTETQLTTHTGETQPEYQPTHIGAPQPTHIGATQPTHIGASQPTHIGAPRPTHIGALQPTHTGAPKPGNQPTHTGALQLGYQPTHTGALQQPTHTGAPQPGNQPTHTGALQLGYQPTHTGALQQPTHMGAPQMRTQPTHTGALQLGYQPTHTGAPQMTNQPTHTGATNGQMVPYTAQRGTTHGGQQPAHMGAQGGQQITTTTPNHYQQHATPAPQMLLGFGQNPFQQTQQTPQQHGILPTQTQPFQQQQNPTQHHPTIPAIAQMYALLSKQIGTPMTESDWQRIDQLRSFPGLTHLPHRPQQQPHLGFQHPPAQLGGLYAQQQPKGLPDDDIARICAIGNIAPHETTTINPLWNRVAKGATKARKKQLVRNWWTGLRTNNPVLPAEPTPDIFNAVIDLNFASDTQAPKANGLYPAMLLSVSASENYEQNLLLYNQDRATFITADDLAKQTGRDFSKLKFTHMKVKDAFQCFWIVLLNLFGSKCNAGNQAWQIWNELSRQHRYDENYERYTHFIGPQLLSASLLKFRDQFGVCPSIEEFRQGYTAPQVEISDLLNRIRNGQDFRDYDILERWFPKPKPKQQQQNNPPRNPGPRPPQQPPGGRGQGRQQHLPPPPTGMAPPGPLPYVVNPNHLQQLKAYIGTFFERHRVRPRVVQMCNAAGITQHDLTGHMALQSQDCKRWHIVGSCNCGGARSHNEISTQVQNALHNKLRPGLERLMADPARYKTEQHRPATPAART